MDIKDVIIYGGFFVIWLFLTIIKNKKKVEETKKKQQTLQRKSTLNSTPPPARAAVPRAAAPQPTQPTQQKRYFTYESAYCAENEPKPATQTNLTKNDDFFTQVADNQEDSQVELQFSQEDFIKGVIFSEILKKPYN